MIHLIPKGIKDLEGEEEACYHTVLTRETTRTFYSIPLLNLNIWRIVTSHPPCVSSMFTVDLNFVKMTSFNAVTLIAHLFPRPSTSVREMYICEAKLTSCYSCEATHHIPLGILTYFKLQNLWHIFNDYEFGFYRGDRG